MNKHLLEEYIAAECLFLKEKDGFIILKGLYAISKDVCDGCGYIEKCDGYNNLRRSAIKKKLGKSVNLSTNAKLAEKMNISKRQVSKLRKKGLL